MALHVFHADFPGPPPEPARATERIRGLQSRRREGVDGALALTCALVAAVVWQPMLVPAIAAGVLASLALACMSHITLRDLVDECAMYPSMSAQPEVARRHARLAAPAQRRALARSLRQLADDGGRTGAAAGFEQFAIRARVVAVRPKLLAVADALEREPGTDPVAVARLWTLVRSGIVSPVYNTTLPAELLDVILSQALYRLTAGTAAERARRIPESSG